MAMRKFLAILWLAVVPAALAAEPATDTGALLARVEKLEHELARTQLDVARNADRGAIENLFANYMYLHNAFEDEKIKALWARRGTPGMSAQYSNVGVYRNYDSIMAYHSNRPSPTGKLIFH